MTDTQKTTPIHSDPAPVDTTMPQQSYGLPCGRTDCPAPDFETGFGLAGGGFGAYEYCDACGTIVSKVQDYG